MYGATYFIYYCKNNNIAPVLNVFYTLLGMPPCGTTMGNDIVRDIHCDVTMDNDVAMCT